MEGVDAMGRIIRLICTCLMILYIIGRMPIPLVVIPLVGCMAIYISDEVKEIKDAKNNSKRSKEVKNKTEDS